MTFNIAAFLIGLVILSLFIALLRRYAPRTWLAVGVIALILVALNSILPMDFSLFLIISIFALAVYFSNRLLRKQSRGWGKRLLIVGLAVVLYIPLSVGLDLGTSLISHFRWTIYGSSSYSITQEISVFGPAAGKRRLSIENGMIVSSERLDCSDCKTVNTMDDLWRKDGNLGLSYLDPVQEAFGDAQRCIVFRPLMWILSSFCWVEYDPYYGYVRHMSSVEMISSDGDFSSTLSDFQPDK